VLDSFDLFEEYDAAIRRAGSPEARAWREPFFPRSAVLMGLGGSLARINTDRSGRYEPTDEGGHPAILCPIWEGPAPGRPEDLIDLVAWVPKTNRMFSRLGHAEVIGEYALLPPIWDPVRVFPDPGAWARAATWDDNGGHGIVVVRWDRVWHRLGGLPSIVVDDIALGQRLREALKPPPPPPAPRILVAASASAKGDAA
jgi:hypothetical protein